MMSTPKTRRESEIWQACDAVYLELGEGKATDITGDKIVTKLLELGFKKGSPNEIYRYRKSWFETRGIEKTQPYQASYLSDPLNRAIQLVKEEIEREARAEIEELKAQYESKLKQLEEIYHATQAELLQFINKNDTLVHDLTQAEQSNHTLMLHNQTLTEKNTLLTTHLNLLEEQVKHLQAHFSESLSQVKDMAATQQKEQASQFLALKDAWQDDAMAYKIHNENQRHKFMMESENYRAEIRQLTDKLKIAESEKIAAQQVTSILKQHHSQHTQKLQEQVALLEDKLNGVNLQLEKMDRVGHIEREAPSSQLNQCLLEIKEILLTSKKSDRKAGKAARKVDE